MSSGLAQKVQLIGQNLEGRQQGRNFILLSARYLGSRSEEMSESRIEIPGAREKFGPGGTTSFHIKASLRACLRDLRAS